MRVWPTDISKNENLKDFNSHTREGVTPWRSTHFSLLTFQLTHPWGCDSQKISKDNTINISTHTPVRVWRGWKMWTIVLFVFQLTHPWGCDACKCRHGYNVSISTHTPVRVWPNNVDEYNALADFNSHTREGVTYLGAEDSAYTNFNSHTREGVTIQRVLYIYMRLISTHTPVRVWHSWVFSSFVAHIFQLTHPWGCDMVIIRPV